MVCGGLLILRSTRWGFVALFAVIGLLPFAALPFKLGFTPTFLDVALLALYFVWIMRVATQPGAKPGGYGVGHSPADLLLSGCLRVCQRSPRHHAYGDHDPQFR